MSVRRESAEWIWRDRGLIAGADARIHSRGLAGVVDFETAFEQFQLIGFSNDL